MIKLCGVLLSLLFVSSIPAQTKDVESLVIGPGDLLHVQFYDTPELEQHPHVDDAGDAPLLFLGSVKLEGETPGEAAKIIESLMIKERFMRHPAVSVSIDQYATQEVTVSGEVAHPGVFAINTPRSVLDVLSLAGGLNLTANRRIVIEHRGMSTQQTVYFVSNDPKVQLRDDVKIDPGDVILVPRVGFVYLLGDVGRPGGYPLASNDGHVTLLQALSNAGSTNKTAVISGVRLMRKNGDTYVEVPLDLGKVEKGDEPDPVLQADDVLIVPFSYVKNFILNGTGIAASVASAALYR